MTHYDTLGLTAEAKTDDVRDAYKRLALVLHPDRPRGDARARLRGDFGWSQEELLGPAAPYS